MNLRLTKTKAPYTWDLNDGTYIKLDQDDEVLMFKNGELHAEIGFQWDTDNKYQTEYRKMRKALIAYLEFQIEVSNVHIFVGRPEEEDPPDNLAPTKSHADKIVQLEETVTHLTISRKRYADALTACDQMITDLRTERRQAEERYQDVLRQLEEANQRINMLCVQIAKMETL